MKIEFDIMRMVSLGIVVGTMCLLTVGDYYVWQVGNPITASVFFFCQSQSAYRVAKAIIFDP